MIAFSALTGGIACGKSLLESYLRTLGCRILDADAVVRSLQEPRGSAFLAIVAHFGEDILTPAGTIDRQKLSDIVFTNPMRRKELESIVHPKVRDYFRTWRKAGRERTPSIASIPLLYESGWDGEWPFVICIAAKPETQIQRLMATRGYTEVEARARIEAQLPIEEKIRRADYVIQNDHSDFQALCKDADALYARLMQ